MDTFRYACRQGHSALFLRMPRLAEELRVLHGAGSFGKWLLQLARIDVLVLDDWGTGVLDPGMRNDRWRSLTTAPPARPPSSRTSCRSSTGTAGSATPPWPTPSSIDCCSARTASRCRATRAVPARSRRPRPARKPSRGHRAGPRIQPPGQTAAGAAVGLHDPLSPDGLGGRHENPACPRARSVRVVVVAPRLKGARLASPGCARP